MIISKTEQSATATRDGFTATVTRRSATTYIYSVERHVPGRIAGRIVLSGDAVYEEAHLQTDEERLQVLAEAHLDEAIEDAGEAA